MIRLLHTADIHLGKQFPLPGNRATEYRNQLLRTFDKIAGLAEDEKVSLLLIAGDLFDNQRVYGITVGKVMSAFRKLEATGIRVCLIPGSHDAYDEDSPYHSFQFPQNVTVFTPEFRKKEFNELDLTVYGLVPGSKTPDRSPLQGLSLSQSSKFHIGMAHCSLKQPDMNGDNGGMIDQNEISGSGLDYLALGHVHAFQDLKAGMTAACYSGSPEPLELDQKGSGNVALVTLEEKGHVEISPVRVATKSFQSTMIDVSPFSALGTIIKMIEARSDVNLILEVILTGIQSMKYEINCKELESLLKARFFHLRVINKSHPRLDEIDPMNYTDKTVIGRFLKLMEEKIASAQTPEEKSLYEKVFRLGINLLRGNLQIIE